MAIFYCILVMYLAFRPLSFICALTRIIWFFCYCFFSSSHLSHCFCVHFSLSIYLILSNESSFVHYVQCWHQSESDVLDVRTLYSHTMHNKSFPVYTGSFHCWTSSEFVCVWVLLLRLVLGVYFACYNKSFDGIEYDFCLWLFTSTFISLGLMVRCKHLSEDSTMWIISSCLPLSLALSVSLTLCVFL